MDDNYLINEYLKTGDENTISMLFENHLQYMFNVAYSFVGDKIKAQDVLQDVCLKVLKNLKSFNNKSSFRTWVYSIICNECLNQLKIKTTFVSTQSDEIYEKSDEINLLDKCDKEYVSEILTNEIDKMQPLDKAMIISFYYEDMSIKEIAIAMNMSESNVKVRLHRIKQNLKSNLEKYEILN